MKKYKFKLEALVKLREFAEDKAKIELGKVNQKIAEVEDKIEGHHNDIAEAYKSQLAMLKTPTNGKLLQFYPQYIQSQNNAIKHLEKQKVLLLKEREERMKDLLKARGEMKVVSKLKEKDYLNYKKEQNKEEANKLDESVQLWLGHKS